MNTTVSPSRGGNFSGTRIVRASRPIRGSRGTRGTVTIALSKSGVFASCCVCEIKVRGVFRLRNVSIVGFIFIYIFILIFI
jgi:hypothetical protein